MVLNAQMKDVLKKWNMPMWKPGHQRPFSESEWGLVMMWALLLTPGARYDILLLKLQLGRDEEFIRCLNVACKAGQFHSGAGRHNLFSFPRSSLNHPSR